MRDRTRYAAGCLVAVLLVLLIFWLGALIPALVDYTLQVF